MNKSVDIEIYRQHRYYVNLMLNIVTSSVLEIVDEALAFDFSKNEVEMYRAALDIQTKLNKEAEEAVKQNYSISTQKILDLNTAYQKISISPGFNYRGFNLFLLKNHLKRRNKKAIPMLNWYLLSQNK